jgi:hypothetical protein
MMRLSQSLPVACTATAVDVGTRPAGWRKMSDVLSHVLSLIRRRARTATDPNLLSTYMLCDIGLVPSEPPYVGVLDQCRMDCRL